MNTPQLADVPLLWEQDGSLRDVYVVPTSLKDWEAFLALASSYPHTHTVNGEQCPMPTASEIFSRPSTSNHLLSISLGRATANCHFFTTSEIELDLEPREVRGVEEHAQVMLFIEHLGTAVGKPVLLTPENSRAVPLLSFEPVHGLWSAAESPAS